jgi:hypothetical protein
MGPNGPGTIGKAQYVKLWATMRGSAAGQIGGFADSRNEIQHSLQHSQDWLEDQVVQQGSQGMIHRHSLS